jgi:hypothetical protein
MKTMQLFIFLIAITLSPFINAQDLADNSVTKLPGLKWEKTSIELGEISLNKPVEVSYKFINTSNAPLVISDVNTSCGCTAAKHSQEPVQPGESSMITVTYNAKNPGVFNKTITVNTSADAQPIMLTLSGEVK